VTNLAGLTAADPLGANLVQGMGGMLGAFNRAGVLVAADVHVAARLARLGGEDDPQLVLAAALAVRGPRYGHVYVDLATVRDTATDINEDVDVSALPWPDADEWVVGLARSQLVAVGEEGGRNRPLRLVGTALYLDRYWRDERAVAADLLARAALEPPDVDEATLRGGLARLFPGDAALEQRWAAASAVLGRISVIAGGPGTGKTTTVGRVLALLDEQTAGAGRRPPLVGLAAPTGKAAARMEEAVHAEAQRIEVSPHVRDRLLAVSASTLHRLLGRRPDSASRFRHDRHNHLPHDVIIIDETSMVALSMMARLTEAVRADARLILVGDPEQLASVEAGAVLGDIVGPSLTGLRMTGAGAGRLGRLTGVAPATTAPPAGTRMGDNIVVLRSNYRFTGPLADLAGAIRAGDGDRVVEVLSSGAPDVRWLELDEGEDAVTFAESPLLEPVRAAVTASGAALFEAAVAGDGEAALDALAGFRVLCAHRRGPAGVSSWTERIEDWLSASVEGFATGGTWYLGRPVIVTANDYSLRLFNGDTGAVVARDDGGVAAAFRRGGSVVSISPSRLSAVDTVYAMTVHKAQGSEFRQVAVVLPPSASPALTRELVYTAVTRARQGLMLAGSEASIRVAVSRPIARASGLTRRLWERPPG
jgi:exodeoxyribonuclease V alpha subunit